MSDAGGDLNNSHDIEDDFKNLTSEEIEELRTSEDLYDGDVMENDYGENEDEGYDFDEDDDGQNLTLEEHMKAQELMRRRDEGDDDEDDPEVYMNTNPLNDEDDYVEVANGDDDVTVMHMIGANDDDDDDDDDEEDEDVYQDDDEFLSTIKGDKKEWFALAKTQRFVTQRMVSFLSQAENQKYISRINQMTEQNMCTLEVDYADIVREDVILSGLLNDLPDEVIRIFDQVAMKVTRQHYPYYERIHKEIFVRISGLPTTDSLRDLRHTHLGQLIRVSGVVTRRTAVYPQLKLVTFDCPKCSTCIGPVIVRDMNKLPKPTNCPNCLTKGPFQVNQNQTVYRNYQKISLQESPGSVSAGRIPRSKDVILLHDLIDGCRPGEEIDVTGVYKHSYDAFLNIKQGFPVFSTIIEANHILKKHDKIGTIINESDKKIFHHIAKSPHLRSKIISSMAPSIYGHEDIKLGIALALFGGLRKEVSGKHKIRGDINVLMVGDPGTAKSQFLKYVEKTAARAVYTTGKGSTAVGLTAAVRKDPLTGEWTLEGGALVLADNGTCLIDEFDKMSDQDRTSIHEAMEQQTISISKAGIVTTLTARCSIVAASNPVQGRYNSSRTFQQNVDLSEPILSRFDILCVVRDNVDPIIDEKLARFVVDSHAKSHPHHKHSAHQQVDDEQEGDDGDNNHDEKKIESIPQDVFKKYILYAKNNFNPHLHNIDGDRITKFYTELRNESIMGGGLPISVRHLESMFRMAEASARMHLRDHVTDEDTNTAIQVMLESFIATQKYSVTRSLRQKFVKYLKSDNHDHQFLMHLLKECLSDKVNAMTDDGEDEDEDVKITIEMLRNKARNYDIYNLDDFVKNESLLRQFKFRFDQDEKVFVKMI
ncbi:DNA replication licensing factor MCM [Acrasis kona]|uniref:DNA replication licensing factor MCM2 n=1 Tax=Acrasis kona TaxID=1008807 RepID=A0AAW2YJX4_9EUKA